MNTVLKTKIGNLRIRELHQEDIPHLQKLCEACADFHLLTQGAEPASNQGELLYNEYPPGKTHNDKLLFGIFTAQDEIMGMIELAMNYPDRETWFIGLLLLHPQCRGRGLGREMLAWLDEFLAQHAVKFLSVPVLAVNSRGKKFWECNGFTEIRQVENFKSGEITTTAHVMRKNLS